MRRVERMHDLQPVDVAVRARDVAVEARGDEDREPGRHGHMRLRRERQRLASCRASQRRATTTRSGDRFAVTCSIAKNGQEVMRAASSLW
jgi:hypothetical protein